MATEHLNQIEQLKPDEYWVDTLIIGGSLNGNMLALKIDDINRSKTVTPSIEIPHQKKQADDKRTICLIEARGNYNESMKELDQVTDFIRPQILGIPDTTVDYLLGQYDEVCVHVVRHNYKDLTRYAEKPVIGIKTMLGGQIKDLERYSTQVLVHRQKTGSKDTLAVLYGTRIKKEDIVIDPKHHQFYVKTDHGHKIHFRNLVASDGLKSEASAGVGLNGFDTSRVKHPLQPKPSKYAYFRVEMDKPNAQFQKTWTKEEILEGWRAFGYTSDHVFETLKPPITTSQNGTLKYQLIMPIEGFPQEVRDNPERLKELGLLQAKFDLGICDADQVHIKYHNTHGHQEKDRLNHVAFEFNMSRAKHPFLCLGQDCNGDEVSFFRTGDALFTPFNLFNAGIEDGQTANGIILAATSSDKTDYGVADVGYKALQKEQDQRLIDSLWFEGDMARHEEKKEAESISAHEGKNASKHATRCLMLDPAEIQSFFKILNFLYNDTYWSEKLRVSRDENNHSVSTKVPREVSVMRNSCLVLVNDNLKENQPPFTHATLKKEIYNFKKGCFFDIGEIQVIAKEILTAASGRSPSFFNDINASKRHDGIQRFLMQCSNADSWTDLAENISIDDATPDECSTMERVSLLNI